MSRISVDINIATSLYPQPLQLLLFQSQGNFWNRLRFVNKFLILFEEINEKFRENYMQISHSWVPSILKTIPGCRVCRQSLFIYLLQFNDNKQHYHKDSLQKSHRPHTKANHLKKKIYIYILNKKMNK